MKKFQYQGPVSAFTSKGRTFLLHPGEVVELDETTPHAKALVARGHLIDPPSPATAPRSRAPRMKAAAAPTTGTSASTSGTTSTADQPKEKIQ